MNKLADRPLVEIFARIGVELEAAASSVEGFHALVEAAVNGFGTTESFLKQAQTIDILQQHLHSLAQFVSELSEGMPPNWRIDSGDAIRNVKLSKLRDRLGQIHFEDEQEEPGNLQIL